MTLVVQRTIGSLFQCFLQFFLKSEVRLKGVVMIWHAVIWVLWRTRREKIFRRKLSSQKIFLIGFKLFLENGYYKKKATWVIDLTDQKKYL
jgi:hypothetical protein